MKTRLVGYSLKDQRLERISLKVQIVLFFGGCFTATCIEGENDAVHSLDLMVVVVSTTGTAGTTVSPVRPDLSIDLLRSRSERLLSRLAKR